MKQKIIATLGVILALIGASDFVPYAFWFGVAGLACAAAGNAITKYSGNAVFTIFGVVLAVISAITPSLAGINELYGRIGLLVGAIFAAVGRGVFDFEDEPPPPGPPRFVSLLLLACLASFGLLTSACDKAKAETVQRQIVLNTDRIASNIGNAIDAVEFMRANKTLSDITADNTLMKIRVANSANGKIIDGLNKYLVTNPDGSNKLQLTEDGKADVRKLVDEATNAFNAALADPVLNSSGNQALSALANALRLAVRAIVEVKEQLKPKVVRLSLDSGAEWYLPVAA